MKRFKEINKQETNKTKTNKTNQTANKDIANENVTNVTNKNIANKNVTNVTNKDIANKNIVNKNIANKNIVNKDIANENVTDVTNKTSENIFFTSDLHFGHKNIIRFDNRPFTSIEEMDTALIQNWNRKVKENDLVYILGDISWYNDEKTASIFNQLKGRKILIRGNHDYIGPKTNKCFEKITDYYEIRIGQNLVVLCHYPIVFFNRHHYGAYMFYGHVHNSHEWQMTENYKYELEKLDIKCNMYNVGCMVQNYEPVTFEEITKV